MNLLHGKRTDFRPVCFIVTYVEDTCTCIHIAVVLSLHQTELSKCIRFLGINNQLMRQSMAATLPLSLIHIS